MCPRTWWSKTQRVLFVKCQDIWKTRHCMLDYIWICFEIWQANPQQGRREAANFHSNVNNLTLNVTTLEVNGISGKQIYNFRKRDQGLPSIKNSLPGRQWCLTHCGRMTPICVNKLTILGSDNGLSPGRRQAIIWTNAGILLTRPLGTNFSEILIEIQTFSFKKMHLKMSSGNGGHFVSVPMS